MKILSIAGTPPVEYKLTCTNCETVFTFNDADTRRVMESGTITKGKMVYTSGQKQVTKVRCPTCADDLGTEAAIEYIEAGKHGQ